MGLELNGPRIARPEMTVLDGPRPVGRITSGTSSPTLQRSIAMAYVESPLAEPGQALAVDLNGKRIDARVVELPFYKRVNV